MSVVNDFVTKYNGKWVEEAGTTALNQCVDLANRYIREVLGLPIIEWTNAIDFPSKAGPAYDYILNTPEGIPQEGDLVIWGGNTYGHIAIFIEGNVDSFRSFDENWPTGSNCHIQNHTYTNVLGWLRKKVASTPDTTVQKDLDTCRIDRDTNHNDRMALYEELGFTGVFNRTVAVERIRQLLALEKSFVAKDEEVNAKNIQIQVLEGKIKQLEEDHALFAAESSKTIQDQGVQIKNLSTSIQDLKTQITTPVYRGWKRALIDFISRL